MTNFVLAIIAQKGGVGKTTFAWNLYIRHLRVDPTAILIDCDNNQYSSFESMLTREQFKIKPEIKVEAMTAAELRDNIVEIGKKHKTIIIECGGRITEELMTAMQLADKIVMPLKPANLEVRTIKNVEAVLEQSGNAEVEAVIVPNMVATSKKNKDLEEMLSLQPRFFKFSKNYIKYRQPFISSFKSGRAVFEMKPVNKLAVSELESVYQEIFSK